MSDFEEELDVLLNGGSLAELVAALGRVCASRGQRDSMSADLWNTATRRLIILSELFGRMGL